MNFDKYFEFEEGNVPIVFSCVHGGYKRPKFLPLKTQGPMIPDYNTYFLSRVLIQELKNRNIRLYYVLNKIHRSKLDLNRPKNSNAALNHQEDQQNLASKIHDYYHAIIDEYYEKVIKRFNRCLFIDFHGFSKPNSGYPDIIFGNLFGNSISIGSFTNNPHPKYHWGLTELFNEFSPNFSIDDGLASSDYNLSYSGGYITYRFFNKSQVNAIQLEVAKFIRFDRNLSRTMINAFVSGIEKCLRYDPRDVKWNLEGV